MILFRFIIEGRIPAKKSRHRVRKRKARLVIGKKGNLEYRRDSYFIAPDSDYREWENRAALIMRIQKEKASLETIRQDVIFEAIIFRKGMRRLDLSNSLQSLEDAAQKAGIIKNDSQIRNHGNSMQIFDQNFDGAFIEIRDFGLSESFIKTMKSYYEKWQF